MIKFGVSQFGVLHFKKINFSVLQSFRKLLKMCSVEYKLPYLSQICEIY